MVHRICEHLFRIVDDGRDQRDAAHVAATRAEPVNRHGTGGLKRKTPLATRVTANR
jgi:hypothetical protein